MSHHALRPEVTAENLRAVVSYDPSTGHFAWLKKPRQGRCRADGRAGFVSAKGYWAVAIDQRTYYAHRLACLYMTGAWPINDMDHINGDRQDNRWENLRSATRSQNLANKWDRSRNTSGYKGVSWSKAASAWVAHITAKKKVYHLGCFDTPGSAHLAYVMAARSLHGAFVRTA